MWVTSGLPLPTLAFQKKKCIKRYILLIKLELHLLNLLTYNDKDLIIM